MQNNVINKSQYNASLDTLVYTTLTALKLAGNKSVYRKELYDIVHKTCGLPDVSNQDGRYITSAINRWIKQHGGEYINKQSKYACVVF